MILGVSFHTSMLKYFFLFQDDCGLVLPKFDYNTRETIKLKLQACLNKYLE